MFYQISDARQTMDGWVRALLAAITPRTNDSAVLDEISTTEILDLAYNQGTGFESALAAHALFPAHVEADGHKGGPVAMSVTFPVSLREELVDNPTVTITVRWGQPSELKLGARGMPKIVTPKIVIPAEMKRPRIGTTVHHLGESGGDRLRSVAGPMREVTHSKVVTINRASGFVDIDLTGVDEQLLYAAIDSNGAVSAVRDGSGAFVGQRSSVAQRKRADLYLWGESRSATVRLRASWTRERADRLSLTIALRNETESQDEDKASASVLGALIMPHVHVAITGGEAEFPPLQYAESKRHFLEIADDDARHLAAARRLYAVQQSGCIATVAPSDRRQVYLTTFGVFDTPREIPTPGPAIADLVVSARECLATMDTPSEAVTTLLTSRWETIRAILSAASDAFGITRLHRFQWDAMQANLEYVATGNHRAVTVVRAPTSAGKTIVFLVNAMISARCGAETGTAVLMFPTRLLNEDMFRRLTAFVRALRTHDATADVTGGLLMGTSDPLYRVLITPQQGEQISYYGACPACQAATPLEARALEGRVVPVCTACGHAVTYMYMPYDVADYLPDLVIATPDKLFYEATVQAHDTRRIGLFGAPVRRCLTCGRACPSALIKLKGAYERCASYHTSAGCPGTSRGPAVMRPIRYMGFDEVHSLYGTTATFLSMFLATLEAMQLVLGQRTNGIRYEAATATISNEAELIEALTRRRTADGEIVAIPATGTEADYFTIDETAVRHRVLMTLPARMTSRLAFLRAILNAYRHLEDGDLEARLGALTANPTDWRFLLGYLFKKQEGQDIRRAIQDMHRNEFGDTPRVEFLSGEAPKNKISSILAKALAREIDVLLANLVISLGVDIHGLNHMIMLGLPHSFTEFVQTAGRTGRGRASGHVHIVMQPFNPRDVYLYRHFHAVLSDVTGYYDVLPVRGTNLHCADEMFGNVAKAVLMSLCMNPQDPQWPHASGVQRVAGTRLPKVAAGIARILCNDPALMRDTQALVQARIQALMTQIVTRNTFMATVMTAPASGWLIHTLRGRTGSVVRVLCADTDMMTLLKNPRGEAADGADEFVDELEL
jgi:hypothetical protein